MATNAENKKKAETYVEARLKGAEPREAARMAKYSEGSKIRDLERPGGPIDNLMVKALEERGITEEFIAKEYSEGLALAKSSEANNADCNAHAKYLLQLGYLKGYGKQGPAVAVQINNTTNPPGGEFAADAGERVAETLQEVRELLGLVRAELGTRESADVPGEGPPVAGGDSVRSEVDAYLGVVPPGGDA